MRRVPLHSIFYTLPSILLIGCSSLTGRNAGITELFYLGEFEKAASQIDKWERVEGRDKLIYLVDRGVILHSAGQYKKSIPYLLEAAKIVRDYDLIRWGFEAGKFITNEKFDDYRGEDYERALVHVILALNYIGLGELDEARVECKQIDRTLRYIAQERGLDYKQNKFALILSAFVYEELGEYNEAYIDYKKLYQLDPNSLWAKKGLLKNAYLLRWQDEYERWKKKFNMAYNPPESDEGELVIIYEAGLAPIKVENPKIPIIPKYEPRYYSLRNLEADLGSGRRVYTKLIDDIETTMIRTVDERTTKLMIKRAAALGTKLILAEVTEEQVKKRNKEVGEAVGSVLKALAIWSEQADLRGIYTFPAEIQIASAKMKSGEHNIKLRFYGSERGMSRVETVPIRINPGRRSWIIVRTIH